MLKRASEADPRDRLLAYLEVAEARTDDRMSKVDRRLFNLTDHLEMHDSDQPELYD